MPHTGKMTANRTFARIILHALGIPTFRHLSAIACVNHHAVADILYKKRRHEYTHKSSILRVYEVIFAEWQKKKFGFTKEEFNLYRNWLNEWRGRLLEKTMIRRPEKRLPDSQMKNAKDIRWRKKRELKRIAELDRALRVFE